MISAFLGGGHVDQGRHMYNRPVQPPLEGVPGTTAVCGGQECGGGEQGYLSGGLGGTTGVSVARLVNQYLTLFLDTNHNRKLRSFCSTA